MEREFNEFGFYESFYDWNSEPIEVAHFDYYETKAPINILLVGIRGGRAIESVQSAKNGCAHESYRWSESVVTQVDVEHATREDGQLGRLEALHTAKAAYDANRRLACVELHWPPSQTGTGKPIVELAFERRGKRIYRMPC